MSTESVLAFIQSCSVSDLEEVYRAFAARHADPTTGLEILAQLRSANQKNRELQTTSEQLIKVATGSLELIAQTRQSFTPVTKRGATPPPPNTPVLMDAKEVPLLVEELDPSILMQGMPGAVLATSAPESWIGAKRPATNQWEFNTGNHSRWIKPPL